MIEEAGMHNGHEYVDLGLPSGTLWATCNIGAESPAEYGDYFAWGEIEPQADKHYGRKSYKFSINKSSKKFNKYTEVSMQLEAVDDVAHVKWGGKWRMPTAIEHRELQNHCYWQWVDSYNEMAVNGFIVYRAKTDEDKGKLSDNHTPVESYDVSADAHVFLPAAGSYDEGDFMHGGSIGYYWSCELHCDYVSYACYLSFGNHDSGGYYVNWYGMYFRMDGHSVRACFGK